VKRFGAGRCCSVRATGCVALALLFVNACGCAVSSIAIRDERSAGFSAAAAEPDSGLVDVRLLLLGDAGAPRRTAEPVLEALRREAARLPARTHVVFLGDNLYPHGLPPASAGDREAAAAALRAQIAAVTNAGAKGIFIPGNHDYALDGWAGLRRETEFIDREGSPRVRALPADGCPGPETLDLGTTVRLVALDTQWWFQDPPKPQHPASSCRCDRESEITQALQDALTGAGTRRVVVVGHHPVASHGQHGGFFPWQQHLFPLRPLTSWAWLPLPVVGSLYPLARKFGVTEQDMSHSKYQRLRDALRAAFATQPPLAYASGHDHNLQLLAGAGGTVQIVSGTGSISRPDPVGRGDDTLAATPHPGFVRIDVLRDGSAWLQFVTIDGDGEVTRPFARWLTRR